MTNQDIGSLWDNADIEEMMERYKPQRLVLSDVFNPGTSTSSPSQSYWKVSEPTVKIKKAKKILVKEDIIINDEPVLFDPEELV